MRRLGRNVNPALLHKFRVRFTCRGGAALRADAWKLGASMRNDRALADSFGNAIAKARENRDRLPGATASAPQPWARGDEKMEPGIRKPDDLCAFDGLTNAHAQPIPGPAWALRRSSARPGERSGHGSRTKVEAHRCSGTPRDPERHQYRCPPPGGDYFFRPSIGRSPGCPPIRHPITRRSGPDHPTDHPRSVPISVDQVRSPDHLYRLPHNVIPGLVPGTHCAASREVNCPKPHHADMITRDLWSNGSRQ
jgi:hypothetical protein